MPLLPIWTSNPDTVAQFTIEQIVATAGNGVLTDESECSKELREYLTQAKSPALRAYVEQCLANSGGKSGFQKSGMVLQDLVNELGRRLDYEVVNGRYQGIQTAIGHDGLWRSPEGHTIIVEVKTTDAYRISLDTIAGYQQKLASSGQISGPTSILIVVGRQDTGELEAQVRGSRHAWDVRLISAEALINLAQLKENSDAVETAQKIRSILVPREYTRLDTMIDVLFATATDIETAAGEVPQTVALISGPTEGKSASDNQGAEISSWEFTAPALLQEKRERIVDTLSKREGSHLVRKSRALYASPDQTLRAALTVSKRYDSRVRYWYAYHPQWDAFLSEAARSFLVLGCMDLEYALAIPRAIFTEFLPNLNTTTKDGSTYWHIHLVEQDRELHLLRNGGASPIELSSYKLSLF